MRRNSVLVPPKKESNKKSDKKHVFSDLLATDTRVKAAPRHLEVVHQQNVGKGEVLFMIKIYAVVDTPGGELMTISCVDSNQGVEVEMRFDEKFPISIQFKKQDDVQRTLAAKEQIVRSGGFDKLLQTFLSNFPKFGI